MNTIVSKYTRKLISLIAFLSFASNIFSQITVCNLEELLKADTINFQTDLLKKIDGQWYVSLQIKRNKSLSPDSLQWYLCDINNHRKLVNDSFASIIDFDVTADTVSIIADKIYPDTANTGTPDSLIKKLFYYRYLRATSVLVDSIPLLHALYSYQDTSGYYYVQDTAKTMCLLHKSSRVLTDGDLTKVFPGKSYISSIFTIKHRKYFVSRDLQGQFSVDSVSLLPAQTTLHPIAALASLRSISFNRNNTVFYQSSDQKYHYWKIKPDGDIDVTSGNDYDSFAFNFSNGHKYSIAKKGNNLKIIDNVLTEHPLKYEVDSIKEIVTGVSYFINTDDIFVCHTVSSLFLLKEIPRNDSILVYKKINLSAAKSAVVLFGFSKKITVAHENKRQDTLFISQFFKDAVNTVKHRGSLNTLLIDSIGKKNLFSFKRDTSSKFLQLYITSKDSFDLSQPIDSVISYRTRYNRFLIVERFKNKISAYSIYDLAKGRQYLEDDTIHLGGHGYFRQVSEVMPVPENCLSRAYYFTVTHLKGNSFPRVEKYISQLPTPPPSRRRNTRNLNNAGH